MNTALIILTGTSIVALVVTFLKFTQVISDRADANQAMITHMLSVDLQAQKERELAFAEERKSWYNERQLLLNRLQFIEADDDDDGAVRGIAIAESAQDQGPAELTVVDEERELELELSGNGEPTREMEAEHATS